MRYAPGRLGKPWLAARLIKRRVEGGEAAGVPGLAPLLSRLSDDAQPGASWSRGGRRVPRARTEAVKP
ncbi:hypothetical protein [Streptomyces davaonensis]|uniref:hypothetical protein n=1 Tax=Streptomyces davaonensis TaxID=348043 RepID=UPI000347825E|nr:hypothetical protein [Streptomyces davaonensis]